LEAPLYFSWMHKEWVPDDDGDGAVVVLTDYV
jgi:hypothetical protein